MREEQILTSILNLLQRVDMKGNEVGAWVECSNYLNNKLKELNKRIEDKDVKENKG